MKGSLFSDKGGYGGEIEKAGKDLMHKLTSVEETLMQTKNEDPLDTCNFPPKLDSQFIHLLNVILSAATKPTDGAYKRFDDLKPKMDAQLDQLKEIIYKDLRDFNRLVQKKNIPPIIIPEKKDEQNGSDRLWRKCSAS